MRHLLLALLLILPVAARGQPAGGPTPVGLVPVGLVLGGGGARGLAHVGVLQVLEENRIPVDRIAGTSMGAVVGSLYAEGQSADDVRRVADGIDWVALFDDGVPRQRLGFRRKRDERDVLVGYRISFDSHGLVLPQGVLRGQNLFLTLAEYLAPARGIRDFDSFAIPFRAVAGDLETGEAVVMGAGDVATAVFASMAVPGGLPPVVRDGRLLVDGFIADNVPIDVARGMGARRLIVVDVTTPLQTRERMSSFVSVISQLQLLLGRQSIERQIESLAPEDVLIRPDLEGISSTGFDRAADAIEAGRAAALAMLDRLRPLALPEAEWAAYLAARRARAPDAVPLVAFVQIDNQSDTPTRGIEERVRQRPGAPLDARAMTEDLQDVYALGGFRAVRYGIGRADGRAGNGVTITTEGDPSTSDWLQLGLGLSTDFDRRNQLVLGFAYTRRNLGGSGLEWRTDARFGSRLLLASGLYAEWGDRDSRPGRMFAEITPYWSRIDTLLYQDGRALSEVREGRIGTVVDAGLLFGNSTELRAGIGYAHVDLGMLIGASPSPADRMRDMEWHLGLTVDTLDRLSFPTHGLRAEILVTDHLRRLGGDLAYGTVTGRIWKPLTRGRDTLLLSAEFGLSQEVGGPSLGDFRLGGFLNLSGLDPDQLRGRHMLLGRAIFYRRLSAESPLINMPLYVGGSAELGNVWQTLDEMAHLRLRPAASLFIGVDTPLGPFTIASGLSRGSGALYLNLGRFF